MTNEELMEKHGPFHITEEQYRTHPAISRSELAKIAESPEKFQYSKNNPTESTPALVFGAAAHKYILEPESFFDEYAVWDGPAKNTKAGKDAWSEFISRNMGKIIIPFDGERGNNFQTIKGMAEALKRNQLAMDIIHCGEHEESFFWKDELTGIELKCRTDIRGELNGFPLIADYKTTSDASPSGFGHSCKKYMYDFQTGFYSTGVEKVTGIPHMFAFIAQEKEPPYASAVYFVGEEMADDGVNLFRVLLGTYKDCSDTGNWYGYEGKFDAQMDVEWRGRE